MPAGSGYDISASLSDSLSSATGAQRSGSNLNGLVIGGSSGVSMTTILAVIAGLAVAWMFFSRRKK